MVGQLSYGKKLWEGVEHVMREHIPPVYDSMMELLPLIDKDTTAFNSYFKARKMPKSTEEEAARFVPSLCRSDRCSRFMTA